jgi:hypothetical protein
VSLLAEASCEQVVDVVGDVAPPAVADPGESGKLSCLLPRLRVCADERAKQCLFCISRRQPTNTAARLLL